MLLSSIANEGTIYHWARDHRTHHKFSETEADPHNANRGFFFAHMGWLIYKKNPKVVEAGKKLDLSDLTNDPVVAFQNKLNPFFSLFMCFIFPVLVSSYGWNENVIPSYLVAGSLRYCTVLHATWLVNSAAHLFGSHPYDKSINPAENAFVAVASGGEGWHNWHHTFPYDYAASELGAERHYNTTKVFIDVCAWVGLVTGRKRALNTWENMKLKQIKSG
jgi:stearoyl-CoA desaturase (delta-9 desaturase)